MRVTFSARRNPGLWRTGPVGITGDDGQLVYEAPPAVDTPTLMGEVIDWLQNGDLDAPVVVRAAMAHLHVVSIHPFRDGNGRVSRIVQSLVLAREGRMSPEFGSIEEYLGEHTHAYYAALNRAHGGTYQPKKGYATGWVEFCVEAHLMQARRRIAQIEETGVRWSLLERLVERRDWPDQVGHRARAKPYRRFRSRALLQARRRFAGDCERGLQAPGGRGSGSAAWPHAQGSLQGQ